MTAGEVLLYVVPIGVAQTLAYLWLSRSPPTRGRTLPMTWVDRAIPFLPWTVIPYLLLLASDFVWPFLVSNRSVFLQGLVAFGVSMGLMFGIFLVWPTRLDSVLPPPSHWSTPIYRWLLAIDGDHGCCPSGHIVVPAIGCWALWHDGSPYAVTALAMFAVLAPTILTTKRHYAVDLPAGLLTAAVGIAASFLIFR